MTSKITIAIAAYNVERYIAKSLLSVLDQDYPNLEIIVVDDRGQDRSIEIVRELAGTHKRGRDVRIISHPQNIGTGGARNTAIDNATGEYIFFLDGDDYINTDAISTLYREMKAKDVDFVVASFQKVDESGRLLSTHPFKRAVYTGDYAIARWAEDNQGTRFPVFPWNKLYKTAFLRDNHIRCVPFHRNEDVWLTFQIMFAAKSFAIIDDVTLNYLMREGSTVHQPMSDFYYNQYLDLFAHMREKMAAALQATSHSLPRAFTDYFSFYYFFGFTCKVLYSDIPTARKRAFVRELCAVHQAGFRLTDFHSLKDKLFYWALKSRKYCYERYMAVGLLIRVMAKLKRIIKRIS